MHSAARSACALLAFCGCARSTRFRGRAGLPLDPARPQSAGGGFTVLRIETGPVAAEPAGRVRGGRSDRPAPRASVDLPVRRRGAVAQQGGTDRDRHRARAAVGRQPVLPEALLSRHPGRGRGRSRQPRRRRRRRSPGAVAYSVQQILVSLPRTAIYALLAVAYALVFGLSGRINLAFGELAAIGAAATVAGASICWPSGSARRWPGLAAGLVRARSSPARSTAPSAVISPSAESGSASPQPSLIATVGLSLFLMEYLRLAQSPVTVWLPPIWSEAWPARARGRFPRQPDADIAGHRRESGLQRGLGLLWSCTATRIRAGLAGLCG